MVNTTAIIILLVTFIVLILLGVHIAYAMGIATVITAMYLGIPLGVIIQSLTKRLTSYTMMAIPFFILAGNIMGSGGISDRLVRLANSLVGWMRGGLAHVNIVASMFFGGISGSAGADTASIGSILIPIMVDDGYDDDFATTVTMTSSIQGILVPPSHNMVLFAIAAGGVSIGKLFLAGFAPGILLGIALMIFSYIVSVRRGYPISQKFRVMNVVKCLRESILGLGTVVIVVFGVLSGIFTATESAAIACLYAFFISFFVYRELNIEKLKDVFTKTIKTQSVVLILAATATAFSWILTYLEVPRILTDTLLGFSDNKFLLLIIINLLLLFLGMIMDMSGLILIITPILLPVMTAMGMSPVQFGAMLILNLGIGLITPPVGAQLFIGSSISGVPIERLSKAMLPFYGVMLVVLLLVTFVPEISLFLPNLLMK